MATFRGIQGGHMLVSASHREAELRFPRCSGLQAGRAGSLKLPGGAYFPTPLSSQKNIQSPGCSWVQPFCT